MGEAATALLTLGQQVLQQQSGEQPGLCFAMVPLLIPALLIFANTAMHKIRPLARQAA